MHPKDSLVGGWTNPFEKYARQIGSWNPRDRGENKTCLKPPPRYTLEIYTPVSLYLVLHFTNRSDLKIFPYIYMHILQTPGIHPAILNFSRSQAFNRLGPNPSLTEELPSDLWRSSLEYRHVNHWDSSHSYHPGWCSLRHLFSPASTVGFWMFVVCCWPRLPFWGEGWIHRFLLELLERLLFFLGGDMLGEDRRSIYCTSFSLEIDRWILRGRWNPYVICLSGGRLMQTPKLKHLSLGKSAKSAREHLPLEMTSCHAPINWHVELSNRCVYV